MLLKYNASRERIVAGLMSGTSVDALAVAITRIRPCGPNIDVELIAYGEFPWSSTDRDAILSVSPIDVTAQIIAVVALLVAERFPDSLAKVVDHIGGMV